MNELCFSVRGSPAPKGSKRGLLHKATGRVVLIESSKRARPWHEAVVNACLEAMEGAGITEPINEPVWVRVTYRFNKPASAGKKVLYPANRGSGDLDKLNRNTFDALVGAGLLKDDSLIVREASEKLFSSLALAATITVGTMAALEPHPMPGP